MAEGEAVGVMLNEKKLPLRKLEDGWRSNRAIPSKPLEVAWTSAVMPG